MNILLQNELAVKFLYNTNESEETSIQKWKINFFKVKIISFIVHFRWNYVISYEQVQVQKGSFSSRRIPFF